MAKDMAFIENNVVTTILWCSDSELQTETLIDVQDRPVAIGDTYDGGVFYRNGEPVLTALEQAQKTIEDMKNALNKLGVTLDE